MDRNSEKLNQGAKIFVEGRLETTWKNREDRKHKKRPLTDLAQTSLVQHTGEDSQHELN